MKELRNEIAAHIACVRYENEVDSLSARQRMEMDCRIKSDNDKYRFRVPARGPG